MLLNVKSVKYDAIKENPILTTNISTVLKLNFLKIPIRIKLNPANCRISFAKRDNNEYSNGTPRA